MRCRAPVPHAPPISAPEGGRTPAQDSSLPHRKPRLPTLWCWPKGRRYKSNVCDSGRRKKKTKLNSLIKRSNSLNLICPISGATSRLSMFSRFHMLAQIPQINLTLSLLAGFLMVLSRVAMKKGQKHLKEPRQSPLPHHGFLPSSTICF